MSFAPTLSQPLSGRQQPTFPRIEGGHDFPLARWKSCSGSRRPPGSHPNQQPTLDGSAGG